MSHDELKLVEWLRSSVRRHPRLSTGIGDDMAVVDLDGATVLLASDMLLDGVHFDTRRHALEQIGRKAVACNLSDCAAMAVRPLAITVSVALPSTLSTNDAERLFEGIAATAEQFDVALAGGDTNRWSAPLAIDVAVLAVPYANVQPRTRAGAVAGDSLFVTGPLGGSLRGKHLTFTPRLDEALELAETLGAALHAMMDITDGLSLDLWRMCQASGVGACLHEVQLLHAANDDARIASQEDGRSVLDHVLGDGEDFELLLACGREPSDVGVPLLPVGRIVESGLSLRRREGAIEPLEPTGYIH